MELFARKLDPQNVKYTDLTKSLCLGMVKFAICQNASRGQQIPNYGILLLLTRARFYEDCQIKYFLLGC